MLQVKQRTCAILVTGIANLFVLVVRHLGGY